MVEEVRTYILQIYQIKLLDKSVQQKFVIITVNKIFTFHFKKIPLNPACKASSSFADLSATPSTIILSYYYKQEHNKCVNEKMGRLDFLRQFLLFP